MLAGFDLRRWVRADVVRLETTARVAPGSTVQMSSAPGTMPSMAATSEGTVVRREVVPSNALWTFEMNSPMSSHPG